MSIPNNEFPSVPADKPAFTVVGPITIDTLFTDYQRLHPSVGSKPGTVDEIAIYGATPAKQLRPILDALAPVYPPATDVDPVKTVGLFDTLSRRELVFPDGKLRVASALGDITVLAAILEHHAPEHVYTALAAVMDQVVKIDVKRPAEKHKLGSSGIVRLGSLALFSLRPDEYTDDVLRIMKNRQGPNQLA